MDSEGAAPVSRSRMYWQLIRSSPRHHQLFMVLVILQCLYLLVERGVLISKINFSDMGELRDAVYYCGVISISGEGRRRSR